MISFLNAALAGALIAAVAPVLIHFFKRGKLTSLNWAGMRFLQSAIARRRNQLVFRDLFLLALRVLIILFAALSVMRPVFKTPGQQAAAARTGGAVILFDNSISTGAGRASQRIKELKQLARAFIDTLEKGDEVSLVSLSSITNSIAEPAFDQDKIRSAINQLQPAEVSSNWEALLEKGIQQLSLHVNTNAQLVLVTDGWRDGWHSVSNLNSKLANYTPIILSLPFREEQNIRIESIEFHRMIVHAGTPVEVELKIGGEWDRPFEVRLLANGKVLAEATATQIGSLKVPVTFQEPGLHQVTAEIVNAGDIFPYDDRRKITVEVVNNLPILLVEGKSDLSYLDSALSPRTNDAFEVTRISMGQLATQDFQKFRVIVLGNIPALDIQSSRELGSFMDSGGGILASAGPSVMRDWRQFVPLQFGEPIEPSAPVGWASESHPVIRQLSGNWRSIRLDNYLPATFAPDFVPLLKSSNGDMLLAEHSKHRFIFFSSTLDKEWNNLPLQPIYVPLMMSLVSYLASGENSHRQQFSEEGVFDYIAEYPFANIAPLTSAETIHAKLSGKAQDGYELWKACLFGSLIFLILETSLLGKRARK